MMGRKRRNIIDRFNEKWRVNDDRSYNGTPCHEWVANKDRDSYGRFSLGSKGKWIYAHRFSYEVAHGKIPEGQYVCHHCDNPSCVNPLHLFIGGNKENQIDSINKGRKLPLTGEKNGRAKLTYDQVKSIREEYSKGRVTYKELSAKHGVHLATIGYIIKGKLWR